MIWHDVADPASAQLDELAAHYSLHSLHVEDCRSSGQRTKVENEGEYLFIILTLLLPEQVNQPVAGNLGLFVGSDFLITVHSNPVTLLERLHSLGVDERSDRALYLLVDGVVESYVPVIESLEDNIEKLQDQVIGWPRPGLLETIADTRTNLMQLRRVLNSTRHVVFQLRHVSTPIIGQEMAPFLRDVHDDLAINLDTIAGERDRLTGVMDIYLSSVSNRTTEATRSLTLLGTAAVPALVITSFFGMAIEYPSWAKTQWTFSGSIALTIAVTGFLLWYLKRHDYLPGGTTARAQRPGFRARRGKENSSFGPGLPPESDSGTRAP
jgi:magnesium transporter